MAATPYRSPEKSEVDQRPKLSEQVERISGHIGSRSPELRELFESVAPHAFLLLVLILVVPFMQPIPLPVVSTPVGAVVALLGLQMMIGMKAWLPERLLAVRLAPRTMLLVVAASTKILRWMEKLTKPRLGWLVNWWLARKFALFMVVVGGLVLMMPPPIFNIMPAWSVALLVIGILERDGAFVLGGYAVALFTALYSLAWLVAGVAVLDWVWNWLGWYPAT